MNVEDAASTPPINHSGWLNSYYVESPPSQSAEKRAGCKVAVCRCHGFRTSGGKIPHALVKPFTNVFAKSFNLLAQHKNQRLDHLRILVGLNSQRFKLFIRHRCSFVIRTPKVTEAGDAASVPGGGLWK